MKKEYVAYKGDKFTIEWYFNEGGRSKAQEYFEELSSKEKMKLVYLFERMANTGTVSNTEKFRHEVNRYMCLNFCNIDFYVFFM